MTLLVGIATTHFCTLAADRRLVNANGRAIDEDSGKTILLACDDARIGMAYTGLASHNGFVTRRWLLQLVDRCAKSCGGQFATFLQEMRQGLQAEFLRDAKLPQALLAILFVGYTAQESAQVPGMWLLSNYHTQAQQLFQLITYPAPTASKGVVEVAGRTAAIRRVALDELERRVAGSKSARAGEGLAISIIKEAANSAESRGLVGNRINTIRICAGVDEEMLGLYYAPRATSRLWSTSIVYNLRGQQFVQEDAVLEVAPHLPPVTQAKPISKNLPCCCGSGLAFKRCHGRLSFPYLPLSVEVEFTEPPFVPAGRKFIFRGYGAYNE